ncbi:hypothetical protein L6270_03515 [Candidatus Parcubacteria bacterium]|nr:hypothetical protein [Patescibacteria group bacterium]MBU4309032.1 hypothetical protein [Patescibacteria group bacterium]MBU4432373.1 hypothetical protein [Patescibacteria group bacterium]MBU4577393.1 hypothetical protein [Patescibacteria group bacterium]MCG2697081.1 hypothetical protein [Candidatus Parcubacteria bacterium]
MKNYGKKYGVKIDKGIYVVSGQPKTDLLPKFLAKNPNDNEIFFLFGNNGTYLLLKGNEKKELQVCETKTLQHSDGGFELKFSQNDTIGTISVPARSRKKHQEVFLTCFKKSVPLEIELFEISDI